MVDKETGLTGVQVAGPYFEDRAPAWILGFLRISSDFLGFLRNFFKKYGGVAVHDRFEVVWGIEQWQDGTRNCTRDHHRHLERKPRNREEKRRLLQTWDRVEVLFLPGIFSHQGFFQF